METPTIPQWIREYDPPHGWTNVFKLVPENDRLYGTETLFGDWNAATLLLAKDGCPTGVIQHAVGNDGKSNPWRHAERARGDSGGWRTNERLRAFAALLPSARLYGSATANLLFDGAPGAKTYSRSLRSFYGEELQGYLRRVLTWVIVEMPRVHTVACLGKEAWYLTTMTIGRPDLAGSYAHARTTGTCAGGAVAGKQVTAFALYHPAARVSRERNEASWAALYAALIAR